MIILKLKIDNVYLYDEFEIDFSYERKLQNNPIDEEYIEDFPNFKYRKVNILLGANSSGKTVLGTVLMKTQNFLSKQNELVLPLDSISDKRKDGYISIDFVEGKNLYRYDVYFNSAQVVRDKLQKKKLLSRDSYARAQQQLNGVFENRYKIGEVYDPSYLKSERFGFGWYYSFARVTDDSSIESKLNIKILERMLKGFDCTIKSIKMIPGSKEAFSIEFLNKDSVIVENGQIIDSKKSRISSGTHEAIRIATILEEIKEQERNYYIDENLVYTHTELEKEALNYMIVKLRGNSQLFFTTHNMDILEMHLPIHAFQFLKNNKGRFEVVDASKMFSKTDRNFRNYVENDVFNTLPDTSFMWELMEE